MFLKMGLVTNTGSGIPRMVRLVREATSCDVDLHLEGNEFVVVFPRPQKEK
jgi:predicted HTH transcriptional regulator